ncbi:hypothetical protein JGH11_03280 [Dysgonomonas sp. Marseille-P4677]|uniref:hypothetical protein n=1 Tax=Dysgonomonas sp. Marseille-P4677 TaxID=2364790 RepID=UPI001913E87B|nr:hypothetical protein [Dysgonomonas sp. Marseille-P4677]MBK5719886.1 hypothetical protein [Dysgonomonas sp. Marseille-P4677]
MSRSTKRTPIFTYVGHSNKISKRFCNRKFRKTTKIRLLKSTNLPLRLDEVMTEWEFKGDGRRYIKNVSDKEMRK